MSETRIIGSVENKKFTTPQDLICCECRDYIEDRIATREAGCRGYGCCALCGRQYEWKILQGYELFTYTYTSTPAQGFDAVNEAREMARKTALTPDVFNGRLSAPSLENLRAIGGPTS